MCRRILRNVIVLQEIFVQFYLSILIKMIVTGKKLWELSVGFAWIMKYILMKSSVNWNYMVNISVNEGLK